MPADVASASQMLSGCSAQAAGWVAARSTCGRGMRRPARLSVARVSRKTKHCEPALASGPAHACAQYLSSSLQARTLLPHRVQAGQPGIQGMVGCLPLPQRAAQLGVHCERQKDDAQDSGQGGPVWAGAARSKTNTPKAAASARPHPRSAQQVPP